MVSFRTGTSPAPQSASDIEVLRRPVHLFNGAVLPNRLVKVALEEGIGWGGLPNAKHRELYRQWGEGGWGTVITGNVQVDRRQLATMHDTVIADSDADTVQAFNALYRSLQSQNEGITSSQPTLKGIIQLSHPGLQSPILTFASPSTPAVSSIASRPSLGSSIPSKIFERVLYPRTSQILDADGWLEIVKMFVRAARLVQDAEWDGVQVHSAHGYLLAEFLSPLTNPNPKPLPGVPSSIPLRLHLLYLILVGINETTDQSFIKSVKLNCSDFVQGGVDEQQATQHIQEITRWRLLDVLEVSGGTYTSPAFAAPTLYLGNEAAPPSKRQAMFAHFTRALRDCILSPGEGGPQILLTGGLHSRSLAADAVRTQACDLVGIGRPSCVDPHFARGILLNPEINDCDAKLEYSIPNAAGAISLLSMSTAPGGIPMVGAGVSTLWHEWQLSRIGRGLRPDLRMAWSLGVVLREFLWFGILEWVWKWLMSCFRLASGGR